MQRAGGRGIDGLRGTKSKGMLGSGRDARDEELAHLYWELEKAQLRAEEVAAYYRGELANARQRAQEEAIRLQAAEVSRRKRAEEQVVHLRAEHRTAQAQADVVLRRYQQLQQSMHELEQQGAERAREVVNRQRESTNHAGKTAEEYLDRLERKLCELRRELASERDKRDQLAQRYRQSEEASRRAAQEARRLIGRLKQALKLSEERRRRAEAGKMPLHSSNISNSWSLAPLADAVNEVDPAAGWGKVPLASSADMAEEFLRVVEDRSMDADDPDERSSETEAESLSDGEAEALMMELTVTEKVERRHAAGGARQCAGSVRPTVRRASGSGSSSVGRAWKWLALIGVMSALAVAATVLYI